MFYATDDFGGRRPGTTPESVHERFTETLSRARPKELAHDYLERETTVDSGVVSNLVVQQWEKTRSADHAPFTLSTPTPLNDIDARQQRAAERWAARPQQAPTPGQSAQPGNTHTPTNTTPSIGGERPFGAAPSSRGVRHGMPNKPDLELDRASKMRREGPEDEFEL